MKTNTIQEAMSEVLGSLGFDAMAAGVVSETDGDRLGKYARVIIRNSPQSKKAKLLAMFHSQNIYPVL